MNNFHFIDVKPTIDRSEVASIKDAIFKRAQEKANNLTSETNENYTTMVQNDVMDVARVSMQDSSMNPFNQFIDSVGLNNTQPVEPQTKESNFPDLKDIYTKEVKHNIESVQNSTYTKSVKDETMAVARNQFRQQTNLMATLGYLNTQASIRMAENAHSKINLNSSQ